MALFGPERLAKRLPFTGVNRTSATERADFRFLTRSCMLQGFQVMTPNAIVYPLYRPANLIFKPEQQFN